MDFSQFLNAELGALVIALVGIGAAIKHTEYVPNKFIPLLLMVIGIGFAVLLLGTSADSVVQGIIAAMAAVYSHQTVKNLKPTKTPVETPVNDEEFYN